MNVWGRILKAFGWKVECNLLLPDKCVVCVAPHTSNYDFLIGLAAYRSLGRKANFLMKEFWFFFPLKYLLRYFGGIPVRRSSKKEGSLTESVIALFHENSYVNLAVTPEGTRSANPKWKTGFLVIARGAGVPVVLAGIDYAGRRIVLDRLFHPGQDIDKDLAEVKKYYSDKKEWAKYPSKFEI